MTTVSPFSFVSTILWVVIILVATTTTAPWPVQAFFLPTWTGTTTTTRHRRPTSRLYAGDGVATNYTWHEEAFELEVSVQVPKHTTASDVQFKATSRSIDLRLKSSSSSGDLILLDGTRPLRGRISLDGTYWVISDAQNDATADYRVITVTMEKLIANPVDDFQVIEYDWKGVYAAEDEQEVTTRRYDEPEPLNVREYAASLGVDIDNINMSMVDKTMFSSGLNLTQASLDQMSKAGLLQETEVTQQADGKEFIVNDGEPIAYSPYGAAVHPDEMSSTSSSTSTVSSSTSSTSIPFVDTSSPWHQTVPVQNVTSDVATTSGSVKQMQRNLTRAAFAADAAAAAADTPQNASTKKAFASNNAKDPIDTLTVARLKEILKSQGLPVSGNKEELKQRLRQQVNALLQGKQ